MRSLLALPAVLALCAASPAAAAASVRLVEAVVEPGFDPRAVLQVAPLDAAQAADPNFGVMASRLGDALVKARLIVRPDAKTPDGYVLLEYKAYPIPFFAQVQSSVNDPVYRALLVTAIDAKPWRESKTVKLLWQVVVDQTGISADADRTIPALIAAGARYYGRNLTTKGIGVAASCAPDHGSSLGSHIVGNCLGADSPAALIFSR